VLLENVEQVQTKIRAVRRDKEVISLSHQKSPALETILQHISNIAESKNGLVEKDRK
jgi:hypothetical protein